MLRLLLILVQLAADLVRWRGLLLRSPRSIEVENLFLRRQLALYMERGVKPRRMDSATRIALALPVLQSWVRHYNTGRPHMALGPSVPDPPPVMPHDAASTSHPRLREGRVVRARSILGGLHHEYFWAPAGAH